MSKHAFDENLKSRLHDATAPVPSEMWDRIAGQIDKPRSRVIPLWLTGLMFVALVAGAAGIYFLMQETDPVTNQTDVIAQQPEISDQLYIEKSDIKKNTSLSEADGTIISDNLPNSQESGSNVTTEHRNNQKSGKTQSSVNQIAKQSASTQSQNNASKSMPKTGDQKPSVVSSLVQNNSTASTHKIDESKGQLDQSTNALNDHTASSVVEDGVVTQKMTDDLPGRSANEGIVNGLSDKEGTPISQSRSAISLLELPSEKSTVVSEVKKNNLAYDPCSIRGNVECYTFTPAKRRLYGEIYAGPLYHASFLTAKSSEAEELVDMREGTEKYLFSYSVGARVSYLTGNGFSIKAGLQYTDLTEKFSYFDPQAERRRLVQVIKDTIRIGPDLLREVYDSIYVTERGQRTIEHPNRYRFVDIPLMMGYEVESEKLVLGIHGGVMVNLAMVQKGRTMNAAGEYLAIDNRADDEPAYKTQAGLSLMASINAGYKISNDFQVFVEPQLRYFLKPLTTSQYPVDHDVFTAGMMFGVRMALE